MSYCKPGHLQSNKWIAFTQKRPIYLSLGSTVWPGLLPCYFAGLTLLDFFCWGLIKWLVYANATKSFEYLFNPIYVPSRRFPETQKTSIIFCIPNVDHEKTAWILSYLFERCICFCILCLVWTLRSTCRRATFLTVGNYVCNYKYIYMYVYICIYICVFVCFYKFIY